MTYKVARAILVDCKHWGFGPFSVKVIVEENNTCHYYLTHDKYGLSIYMFSQIRENFPDDETVAEEAYYHALSFMPDYIQKIEDEENDCPF